MKNVLIITVVTVGLGVMSAGAQVSQTSTHSEANGQGGLDTVSRSEQIVVPPNQPKLAMFDRALDESNPLIAINDPTKFGHPALVKAVVDEKAIEPKARVEGMEQTEQGVRAAIRQYQENVRSGKWKAFRNGE